MRAKSGCCCPSKLNGGTSCGTCRRGDSGRCSEPLAQVSSVTKHRDHVCPAIHPWVPCYDGILPHPRETGFLPLETVHFGWTGVKHLQEAVSSLQRGTETQEPSTRWPSSADVRVRSAPAAEKVTGTTHPS